MDLTRLQNFKNKNLSKEELINQAIEDWLTGFVNDFFHRQFIRLFNVFLGDFKEWRFASETKKQLDEKKDYIKKLEDVAIEREKRILELKRKCGQNF